MLLRGWRLEDKKPLPASYKDVAIVIEERLKCPCVMYLVFFCEPDGTDIHIKSQLFSVLILSTSSYNSWHILSKQHLIVCLGQIWPVLTFDTSNSTLNIIILSWNLMTFPKVTNKSPHKIEKNSKMYASNRCYTFLCVGQLTKMELLQNLETMSLYMQCLCLFFLREIKGHLDTVMRNLFSGHLLRYLQRQTPAALWVLGITKQWMSNNSIEVMEHMSNKSHIEVRGRLETDTRAAPAHNNVIIHLFWANP